MALVTPRGFKDVLPEEAAWRETLLSRAHYVLSLWGYKPIETPTLEVLEMLELGGTLGKTPIKLFDDDGKLLALRPDVTLSIARVVASRLAKEEGPFRFRYSQPVFREEESLKGQSREFMQIGAEFIGLSGTAADAEIILLLIETLKSFGLTDFKVAICTVSVLQELLFSIVAKDGATELWRRAVLSACHKHDFVEIEKLAGDPHIDSCYASALIQLVNIRGGIEAIRQCKQLAETLGCSRELDELQKTYEIIEAYGAREYLMVDFSIMNTFDYYTGVVFEAYAPGLGIPLGSGGRYDRMIEAYGKKSPAAGFACNLDRVMLALLKQQEGVTHILKNDECVRVPIDNNTPSEAFLEASRIRAEGRCAILFNTDKEENQ